MPAVFVAFGAFNRHLREAGESRFGMAAFEALRIDCKIVVYGIGIFTFLGDESPALMVFSRDRSVYGQVFRISKSCLTVYFMI